MCTRCECRSSFPNEKKTIDLQTNYFVTCCDTRRPFSIAKLCIGSKCSLFGKARSTFHNESKGEGRNINSIKRVVVAEEKKRQKGSGATATTLLRFFRQVDK